MKILNYRTGFAANSSSVHSPMIVKNIEDVIERRHGSSFYYDSFTIKDKDRLLEYLGSQINSAMNHISSDLYYEYREDVNINKIIIDGLLEKELFKDQKKYSYENLCVQYDMVGWILPRKKGCLKGIPNPLIILAIICNNSEIPLNLWIS